MNKKLYLPSSQHSDLEVFGKRLRPPRLCLLEASASGRDSEQAAVYGGLLLLYERLD
jgi:hypothetical protein